MRSAGFSWPRECPNTFYCWEAVTADIDIMKKFFDFAWDDYYNVYYVKACGGEYGTDQHHDLYHQYLDANGRRINRKLLPGQTYRVNITAPPTITGRGGTEEMDISYVCTGDFCSAATGLLGARVRLLVAALTAAAAVVSAL